MENRNQQLIEKYFKYIRAMQTEQEKTDDKDRFMYLDGKISILKLVIIDLKELPNTSIT